MYIIALNIALFAAFVCAIFIIGKRGISRTKCIFIGILFGIALGVFTQFVSNASQLSSAVEFYKIFSVGYIRMLQMMIFPVIIVAILMAMTKISRDSNSSIVIIVLILLTTTAIAAFFGIVVSLVFDFRFDELLKSATFDASMFDARAKQLSRPFHSFFTDFITTNPFLDLTGARGSSIAAVVIFSMILGFAYMSLARRKAEIASRFKNGVEVWYELIMIIISFILKFTPYGIFALFATLAATSKLASMLVLAKFLGAAYIAIFIMFVIHGIILGFAGVNPFKYYFKVMPLLIFASVSRSSAAALPMNIQTQVNLLGVKSSIASMGASFGLTLGQNGCAGVYPAMLATFAASLVGIDPFSPVFIMTLLAVVTINSFGIAGVGGGATFAAIATLSFFGMPLEIVFALASVEPIVDMGRTALNVNGSVVASIITSKLSKSAD